MILINIMKSNRTADSLFHCLMMDTWPSTAACVDFGLDDCPEPELIRRYTALQAAVREGGVTADQLHNALRQSGPGITELIRSAQPDKEVTFTTVWDTF